MAPTPTKTHSLADLEAIYNDAEQCDSELFSEMRSNLLLISGEHYNRRHASFFKRVRDAKELSDQQKIRLTKNHVQNIHKKYVNNVIAQAPGVGFEPKNQSELQDQKAAELHKAVWEDGRDKYGLDELVEDWCDDFFGIGEVATKIFYDAKGGKPTGRLNQAVDEAGQPVVDEMGQPVGNPDDPEMSGEFIFEPIHGFNLLRPSECKEIRKAHVLITRKMGKVDELKLRYPEHARKIEDSMDETIVVFDTASTAYRKSKGEAMLREFWFRPCAQYPQGYFYITLKNVILEGGELPGGIFPIIVQPCERIPTSCRGRSIVKHMRPYQAEINRSASKMAEHQITLGDDKLLIQSGTTVSPGVALPGVRSINYTGATPEILQGRSGAQYLEYMQAQVAEMYTVMNVQEDSENKQSGQLDPYALLFRSASQKKKFQRYVRRFERFLVEVAKTYLALAKLHLSDEAVIYAVGRAEQINIAEFRSASDLCYQIKVSPESDDIESKMGKQLVMNHVLQYIGNKLEREDIGKIMRNMPYANAEGAFDDFTLDYDSSTNDLLLLDRGELPPVHEYDNHIYAVKRAVSRVRKADFDFLPEQVKMLYGEYIRQHEMAQAETIKKLKAAEADFIPTGGYLVTCRGLTMPDEKNPQKVKEVRLPYEAIVWLVQRLEAQGQSLEELEKMNQGALAQISDILLRKDGAQGGDGIPPQAPVQ